MMIKRKITDPFNVKFEPFDNYGSVEQEEVLKEEQQIREYKYAPPTPLVVLYNKLVK